MKIFPNLHTHTHFCDGKGSAEQYILKAAEKKMPSLGFSGHAPVPFTSKWNMSDENFFKYLKQINVFKIKYAEKIEIYTGIEADYLKNTVSPDDFKNYNLDFIIGSIHYIYPENRDKPWDFIISPAIFENGLNKFYKNDIKKLIADYFEAENELAQTKNTNIIGHFDQINKFNFGNKYFSETDKFYLKKAEESLKIISEQNKIVEINTRGKFKKLSDKFYPSPEILKICNSLNIKITLSADAHSPDEINSFLPEAAEYAKNCGYKTFVTLEKNKFTEQAINEYI